MYERSRGRRIIITCCVHTVQNAIKNKLKQHESIHIANSIDTSVADCSRRLKGFRGASHHQKSLTGQT